MRRRHNDNIGRWISNFQHDAWLFHFLFGCVGISCTINQRVRLWWRWRWHWHRHHHFWSRFTCMHAFVIIDCGAGQCCITAMCWRCVAVVPISVRGRIMWMLLNWNVWRWCRCIDDCRHCMVITKCGKFICIRWLGIWLRKFTTANSRFKQWITANYAFEKGYTLLVIAAIKEILC